MLPLLELKATNKYLDNALATIPDSKGLAVTSMTFLTMCNKQTNKTTLISPH